VLLVITFVGCLPWILFCVGVILELASSTRNSAYSVIVVPILLPIVFVVATYCFIIRYSEDYSKRVIMICLMISVILINILNIVGATAWYVMNYGDMERCKGDSCGAIDAVEAFCVIDAIVGGITLLLQIIVLIVIARMELREESRPLIVN